MISSIIGLSMGLLMSMQSWKIMPATVDFNYHGHVYIEVQTSESRIDEYKFIDHKRDFEEGQEIKVLFDTQGSPEEWEILHVYD